MTGKGQASLARVSDYLMPNLEGTPAEIATIRSLLQRWQTENKRKGFGQCQSCRFNRELGNDRFQCGLTGAPLAKAEIRKICREHEFNAYQPQNSS